MSSAYICVEEKYSDWQLILKEHNSPKILKKISEKKYNDKAAKYL